MDVFDGTLPGQEYLDAILVRREVGRVKTAAFFRRGNGQVQQWLRMKVNGKQTQETLKYSYFERKFRSVCLKGEEFPL